MRPSRAGWIVATGLLALLALGPTTALASKGSTVVQVPGAAGWVPTGIVVSGGQELPVRTTGFVMTAFPPQFFMPGGLISGSGPAGQPWWGYTCGSATRPPGSDLGPCAYDDAWFGTLIGRVGETSFVVGDTSLLVIPDGLSGELWLTVNDYANTYGDNSGQFTVIFYR